MICCSVFCIVFVSYSRWVVGEKRTFAATRVRVRMRVEVSTLGVDMANGDLRTKGNVGECVYHSTAFEGVLEFRAHETVTVTRVFEDQEMDLEHEHVENDGNSDEANGSSDEMSYE